MTRRSRALRRLTMSGDSGSMAFYVLIAVVGMALGALAVPMIIAASQTTRSDVSRVHALDAAQAGVNVMVGQLRAAQSDGVGTSTKLPCSGPTGRVNGTGQATYAVSVDYYRDDPVTVSGAVKMRCIPGYGTYDAVSGSFVPKFARVTSLGRDGEPSNGSTPGRTLQSTYVFKLTDLNITGGQIRIYPAGTTSTAGLCMDAGSSTPIAGAAVTLQSCATPPTDQQIWAYRSDLTLQLLSSVTTTYRNGLCVDTAAPPTSGRPAYLAACGALGSPPYTQQWSFNDNGNYEASTSASATTGTLAGLCLRAATQTAGTALTIGGCGGTTSTTSAWIPSPAVGPGAAQAPQLINYYEFGRCLDVSDQNVNADRLIDYPCKQNPNPGAVSWNQKFTTPPIAPGASSGTGQIYTTTGGRSYCLTSPGALDGNVTVSLCSSGSNQTWTVYNGSSALSYSAKYTIVDSGGRCLGLTSAAGSVWSVIDVETCTGATEQKWNARADLTTSLIQNVTEVPNR